MYNSVKCIQRGGGQYNNYVIFIMYEILMIISGTSVFLRGKGKGKSVPLHAWRDPEGSRKLWFPDYVTMAQVGGKIVSLTRRPLLPPGNTPVSHFC